jgi:hypothetical protein
MGLAAAGKGAAALAAVPAVQQHAQEKPLLSPVPQVNILGHSGCKFKNPLALLLINPFLAAILVTGPQWSAPCMAGPAAHQPLACSRPGHRSAP